MLRHRRHPHWWHRWGCFSVNPWRKRSSGPRSRDGYTRVEPQDGHFISIARGSLRILPQLSRASPMTNAAPATLARDPVGSAHAAGLRHTTDTKPGIRRYRALAAQLLRELDRADSAARAKKNIVQAVEAVAKGLGNTKAVCRKCYIHPAVFDAYLDGSMLRTVAQRARRAGRSGAALSDGERAVLDLLQRRLSRAPRGRAANATLSESLRSSLRSQSAARRRSAAPRGAGGSTRSSRAAARSS